MTPRRFRASSSVPLRRAGRHGCADDIRLDETSRCACAMVRLECFGLDVRIKQPHGRFEMRQIGAMLIGLSLKTFDRVGDFQSLVAQGRNNQRSADGGSRGRIMTSGERSGSRAAPVEGAGGSCYIRPDSRTTEARHCQFATLGWK